MKVVILAGGLGTRISEESHLLPKPMIEIGGQPILWHIMKYYSQFGHQDFVICCGYRGYMIKKYFADYYLHQSDVTFDFGNGNAMEIHNNFAEPWRVTMVDTGLETQTGGRIKRIQPYVGNEPFLLTYGDGVSDVDLHAVHRHHKARGKIVTMTAVQPGGRFGVINFASDATTIAGFEEKAKENGGWINAGFMVVEPEIFEHLPDDTCVFEQNVLPKLSAEGRIDAYKHHGYWQCMDTQRDRMSLEQRWSSGDAPWKVW
ncbi:MAG: Glucose-1-phosphate cytidylyltransferase [Desulfovibrio sp.]